MRQVPPKRLASLNKCMRGMRVGNFELVQEQLHLGDALGNRFEITLRYVQVAQEPGCTANLSTLP
jgi:tRNA pseudouridine13 synthase